MEIHIKHIPQCQAWQVQAELARVLHNYPVLDCTGVPVNFHLRLIPSKTDEHEHAGYGFLTLPTWEAGEAFLEQVEGRDAPTWVCIDSRRLWFTASEGDARPDIIQNITRLPYIDAEAIRQKEELEAELHLRTVSLQMIQFGWEMRDNSRRYSVEWERSFRWDCSLTFGGERREMRIQLYDESYTTSIIIQLSHIQSSMTGHDHAGLPIIFLRLYKPPSYERKLSYAQQIITGRPAHTIKSERLHAFDPIDAHHLRVLPFTSLAIRLICREQGGPEEFRYLCSKVRLRPPDSSQSRTPVPVKNLGLFSLLNFQKYKDWLKRVHWRVAFQVESMLRGLVASLRDISEIWWCVWSLEQKMGHLYASELLRRFNDKIKKDIWSPSSGLPPESFYNYYRRFEKEFIDSTPEVTPSPFLSDPGVFESFHVAVTPTTIALEGPLPERSNRVMRMFPNDHDCFLRVSFVDENRLQYRSNRDTDGPLFINGWIKRILREGMVVAGREFRFLGYSQSALKSHTVWFVLDDPTRPDLTVESIIGRLGRFDNLEYDPRLIYCPARYGARISQAFTATDPSIVVGADQVMVMQDVKSNGRCFTEGVGTLSVQMAKAISRVLKDSGKRAYRRLTTHAGAFQLRFQGSKGVVSIDHRLPGNVICIRPSMIKFEAPASLNVEIAQAFDRPRNYYLNRPLIMILEALGVPYQAFENLQAKAIRDVHKASRTLRGLADIMEAYGLGNSYRLPSILINLAKLDVEVPEDDNFFHRTNDFTVHHILRDLKHHARIPVPQGWTLVGIADIHNWLQPREVYACIRPLDGTAFYLEGSVMVSRSPTIHPGDVQVLTAVRPPPGSPYLIEPLPNTLVFSIQGDRPVYTGLGGGDLDGDLYNVTTLRELMPPENYSPADYAPSKKRVLGRPSTIDDVADFVADYINSDIIGLVAINWLIIADQSLAGIFDKDCLLLCKLHSDAVDYPKSGNPVSAKSIPYLHLSARPDWNAPETVDLKGTANYYTSERAIGKLFRAVTLPVLDEDEGANFKFKRKLQHIVPSDLDDVFAKLCMEHDENDDPWNDAIKNRVAQFIDIEPNSVFVKPAVDLLNTYVVDLSSICSNNTLSNHRLSMLSEEEAIVGTIVAKCSQKTRRKDTMAKLREQTDFLVKHIRGCLLGERPPEFEDEDEGEEDEFLESWLARAWAAWQVSRVEYAFGCTSFGWIALGEIFDAIKAVEQREGNVL